MRESQELMDDKTRELALKGDGCAVLIPCYNEEMTIGKVVDDFSRVLPFADIYVYDNNSSDDTAKIAEEHGAIVKKHSVQGKGNVVRQMLRDIEAERYLMVDGDDTYPAEDAPSLIEPLIKDEADMVVGDRLSNDTYAEENKRAFHGFGNALVCTLIRWMYHYDYEDVMTGYRSFSKVFADNLPLLSDGFEMETEMSIHAVDKRWRIVQVPIAYRDRPEGSESKLSTIKDGFKVLCTIMSLFKNYRPLALFFTLFIICLAVGLIIGIPLIVEFANTGLVPKLPSTVLCVGFIGTGILFLCSGLILDTTAKNNRMLYERDVISSYRHEAARKARQSRENQ